MEFSLLEKLKVPSLLVAMPQLQDPNFVRAVLLMVELNDEGAMGLILNRPSELPLAAVLDGPGIEIPRQVPTWTGGPVGTSHGLILTIDKNFPPAPDDITTPDFAVSSSEHCLANLINYAEDFDEEEAKQQQSKGAAVLYPYRFLVGYSGWGAQQLETEIKEGSWISLPYDHDLVFNTPWPKLWDKAIAKLGIKPTDISTAQTSTYLN